MTETLSPTPPPDEVAQHFATYHSKTLQKRSTWQWYQSKLWLIEKGFLENDVPPEEERPSTFVPTTAIGAPPPALKMVGTKATAPKRRAVMVCMADVQPEEHEWLWRNRIPLHAVAMLVGAPGDGKSSLALMIAATVSVGGYWPNDAAEPLERGSVVLLQAEMRLATTVRKRLDDAGADQSRIHALTTIEEGDGRLSPFSLARDLPILEEEVAKRKDVRLVIIDPISSYLQGADENKSGDVRGLTDPLFAFAEKNRLTVLLVAHLNKGMSTNILGRISGSIAFAASARMIWYVSRHPDDRARRVMSFVKGNMVDDVDPPALTYRYINGHHKWDPKPVEWCADEVATLLLQRSMTVREEWGSRPGPAPADASSAADFVLKLVTSHTGPILQSAALDAALQAGYSESTFRKGVTHLQRESKLLVRAETRKRVWLELPPETQGELPIQPPTS